MFMVHVGKYTIHGASGIPKNPFPITLPETDIAHEMDDRNTSFLLGWPIFRCLVSGMVFSLSDTLAEHTYLQCTMLLRP